LPWWESIDTIKPAGKVVFAAFADDAERAVMQATPPRWRYGLLLFDVRIRIIPVRRFKRSGRLAP
jgi:hypothetical protein